MGMGRDSATGNGDRDWDGGHGIFSLFKSTQNLQRLPYDAAVARTVVQGLWGAAITYVILLLAAPLTPALYASGLGIDPGSAAYAAGRDHLVALIVGSAGLAASNVLEAAFRGLGQTRTALYVTACTVGLAAVLDPVLMMGVGPFPRMGIVGAAVGYSCAVGVGAVLHAWALRRVCGIELTWAPPDAEEIARMVKIGAPLATSGVVFTLVYISIGRIASGLDETYLAAMGLGQKFEAVAFTVCEGFRLACATLVGQWLGAGRPKRARAAVAVSVKLCVVAMVPFAVALFAFGPMLVGTFSSDPAIVAAASGYLRWNSGVLVFLALEAVTEGAFTGAGNTFPVLCIGSLCNLGRVPVAHYLTHTAGWGISGVWAAIVASQILKAVCKSWWFRTRVMTRLEEEGAAAAAAAEGTGMGPAGNIGVDDEDEDQDVGTKGLLGLVW
jgi:putative MATE family efflux protein